MVTLAVRSLVLCVGLAAGLCAPITSADTQPVPSVEQQLQQVVADTFHRNLHPDVPVIYPSPAYYNPYLRDSFWAAQALGDRRFAITVLNTFAGAERADGDPPTMFVNAYRWPHYHDDESAALLLIWAWRNHTLYGAAPPHKALVHALRYLLGRAVDGYLISRPGTFNSWWDAYRLAQADVLSYDQGLFAVALHCAEALGLSVPAGAQQEAEAAYRGLYDRRLGYLRLSRNIPASDASALTGEFLSLWIFDHAMLRDTMVLSTIAHLTPFESGFRVVALPVNRSLTTDAQGYFPADPARLGVPGDYQNGASWLLFDALSLGAAGLHGLPHALHWLRARLAMEFRHGVVLHEYLRSSPQLAYYESEPPYRDVFSWDTFVLTVDGVLTAHLRQPVPCHPQQHLRPGGAETCHPAKQHNRG